MFGVEALVLATCLQQKGGCSESQSAYYQYNKDVQQVVKDSEAYGKKLMKGNEWAVYAISPVAAIATGKPVNIHLYKGWVLAVDVKQELVMIKWNY